jgi:hypothetical protein
MKKLKLDLNTLAIDSFEADAVPEPQLAPKSFTFPYSGCFTANTCYYDGHTCP